MTPRILQVNFKFNVPRADYESAVAPLANPISEQPGLIWKVWVMNEAESEAGGIHLFEGKAALQGYLNGAIIAGIASHPALSDMSVKTFEVMGDLTAITRGPVVRVQSA